MAILSLDPEVLISCKIQSYIHNLRNFDGWIVTLCNRCQKALVEYIKYTHFQQNDLQPQ